PADDRSAVSRFLRRLRPALAGMAVVLALVAVLPPAATYTRQYSFAQALQFAVFAVLAPALVGLGTPPRAAAPRRLPGENVATRLPPAGVAAWRLVPFMALVIAWRLPAVLDALARYPALSVAELVTLAGAGLAVWRAIAGLTRPDPLSRPVRAAIAAAAMWTIWIIAYVTGMSALTLIPRSTGVRYVVSAAADRQLATAVLWAVPAICFAPVVYYMLVTWLGERDKQDDERDELTGPEPASPIHRPPRGWRRRGGR
ncbi:MAG: cytochrome c oxidase assembly protein, partial [Streptosporangiaceae bacterium]